MQYQNVITLAVALLVCACSSSGSNGDAGDAELDGPVFLVDGEDLEDVGDAGELPEDLEDAGDAGELPEDLEDAGELDAGGELPEDAGALDAAADGSTDAEPSNACGGSSALQAEPGTFCPGLIGTCDNGRNCAFQAEWTCAGLESVYCGCCEL